MVNDKPNLLYKYLHEERMDVLANGMIRYTQPSAFNDPFEALPYIKAVADSESIEKQAKKLGKENEIFEQALNNSLSSHPKFRALSQVHQDLLTSLARRQLHQILPNLIPQMQSFFRDAMSLQGVPKKMMYKAIIGAMNDAIGIFCLTETFENLLMWSHYSNSHKGFVLGFNADHTYFQQTEDKKGIAGYVKKVRYTTERPKITLIDLSKTNEQNLDNWVKNIIWVKSGVWEYESEWRMINGLRDADFKKEQNGSAICLFHFPLESIERIYLGCKMERIKKGEILSIIKAKKELNHTIVYEAYIDEKLSLLSH